MNEHDRRKLKAQAKRVQFLKERADILGGSDMVHLLGLEPFGCQRRLCYDKSGIEPDFPQETNADMERGAKLEHMAVQEYEELTGRTAVRRGLIRRQGAEEYPWIACHIDREIHFPGPNYEDDDAVSFITRRTIGCGPGVLEVKIPSAWNYQILARQPDLLILDEDERDRHPWYPYYVQLQWGLAVTGWRWGSIWIWSPDKWKGRFEDYRYDYKLIEYLLAEGHGFWTNRQIWVEKKEFQVDPFPAVDRLEPTDRRCLTCPWRRKCQGLGEMPSEVSDDATKLSKGAVDYDESIRPLVEQYVEVRARFKEAEKEKGEVAEALALVMGERQYVACGAGKVSYTDVAACEYTVKREAGKRLTVKGSNNNQEVTP